MATAARALCGVRAGARPRRGPGRGGRGGEAARARRDRLRAGRARAGDRGRGPRDDDRARRQAEATVIGLDARLPAPNAAFANAMLCHGLDFDDTHSDSVAHVSTVVVPAAAALAEARGASGRELLTAIIAGNEIVTRIGMATPGAFHKRGFHPTAICGIFGATAAAARLGGLDADAGDERARDRRQHGLRPLRLPRRRDARRSRSTPPGRHTERCSRAGWRRTAPRGRPGSWRGASASSTPSSTRGSTSSPSSPTWARAGRRPASPTRRSRPATSSTARSARPGRSPTTSTRTRSRTCSSPSPRRASRSCSSRPTARSRRAPTTRASSRSSTRPRRCSCTAASA